MDLLSSLRKMSPESVDQEYSVVRSQSLLLKKELRLTTESGSLKDNTKKNRYKDILPYDQTRVVLSPTSESHSDYINASFIKGPSGDCRYIASQGPLSSTLVDFWRMIWQHKIKVIVMACRETEMGKRKCENYWAPVLQSAAFGPFTVSNQREVRHNEDLLVRTLTVCYQQETHSVIQHQFLSWPDHDVPPDTAGVLDLLDRARSSQGADTSPLLIHCSAGCGRTGVICALDYIHDLLVTECIRKDFSILNIVLELRRQRPSAVQTKDQYSFIHRAVVQMLERFLQASDQQLYCNQPEVKKPEKTASSINRSSQKVNMNETYAVINKPKKAQQPPPEPTYTVVATPSSGDRMLPSSHHYDNDYTQAPAAPIYSAVKPRRPLTLQQAATPIYDMAAPVDPREGSDYHLVSAANHDYEDVSSEINVNSFCSPGGIGPLRSCISQELLIVITGSTWRKTSRVQLSRSEAQRTQRSSG